MAKITFDQLVPIYRATKFNIARDGGRIAINDHALLETLKLINQDDDAYRDSNIRIVDPENLAIGNEITVQTSTPRIGLGVLATDLDDVIANASFRIVAPKYYLIEDRFAYNDAKLPESVVRYQATVRLVKALSEAAAFVDPHLAEATFLGPGRVRVPIVYKALDLVEVTPALVEEIELFVFERIHKDQKLAILSSNIIEICKAQPEKERFGFLLKHLRELVSKAQEGYKLFASEFSYEKIRGKTEEAISDYTAKIHKTFHDIQNQVMGVPVATIIVATQFKSAAACTTEFWANLSISVGATLFTMLLSVAIYNQMMTLKSIKEDLVRQKGRLQKDYASVAEFFLPEYSRLKTRLTTHRWVLRAIVSASWIGVVLTWYIYNRLTLPTVSSCF